MRQIIGERTDSELGSHALKLRLSPLALIVFALLVGFTFINVGIRAAAQSIPSPSNPFSDYADVFPGQPASALSSKAFSCRSNEYYYQDATEESCTLMLTTGVFSSVEVIISDGIIRESIFLIRDNSLQVGDLLMFLEMPTIPAFYSVGYFFLPNSFIITETTSYIRQFSLFLPVWSISFTDTNLLT